jgi:DNA-binding PadR family transcriptional regulator
MSSPRTVARKKHVWFKKYQRNKLMELTMHPESQTYSWIFLCISEEGSTLQNIIAMADGINHAIPSHKELQTSLGWLQAKGLICKNEKRFALTEQGSKMLARLRKPDQSMFKNWEIVSAELQTMLGETAPPANISVEETKVAYQAYKKDFWKRYKELKKHDANAGSPKKAWWKFW